MPVGNAPTCPTLPCGGNEETSKTAVPHPRFFFSGHGLSQPNSLGIGSWCQLTVFDFDHHPPLIVPLNVSALYNINGHFTLVY
jgi:hypothetical protein